MEEEQQKDGSSKEDIKNGQKKWLKIGMQTNGKGVVKQYTVLHEIQAFVSILFLCSKMSCTSYLNVLL
jgi:hypothetical protein